MIEVSITEIFLFAWGALASIFWWDAIQRREHFKVITMRMLSEVAKGKLRVKETDQGFEFEQVQS